MSCALSLSASVGPVDLCSDIEKCMRLHITWSDEETRELDSYETYSFVIR